MRKSAVSRNSTPLATSTGCPTDTLPDHGVCIPVPKPESNAGDEAEATLELLPGRPADYARYLTPIAEHTPAASSDGGVIVAADLGTEIRAIRLEAQIGATRWAASWRRSACARLLGAAELNSLSVLTLEVHVPLAAVPIRLRG